MIKVFDRFTDDELIEYTLSDDKKAYSVLVQRYQQAVLGLARHFLSNLEDAEDVAQEAFLQAYLELPRLNNHSKFKSWLRQITANLCKMRLRQKRVEVISLGIIDPESLAITDTKTPDAMLEQQERSKAVQIAIDSLPSEYQLVLTLFYREELSYEAISDFLDLPISTVKWRLHKARQLLKREMMDMTEESLKKQRVKTDTAEKVERTLIDDWVRRFEHIFWRIKAADRGLTRLEKRRIIQPGGAQWVKCVWNYEIDSPDYNVVITNPQYWRVATEANDAEIKAEKGKWEKWWGYSYVYLRKTEDGGSASDAVDVYAYMGTDVELDENGYVILPDKVPIFDEELFSKLASAGFEKISEKNIPQLRFGSRWADEKYFREVKQWEFHDKEGREIYLDIGVFSGVEVFSEFVPSRAYGGKLSGCESTFAKIRVFVPLDEEQSAVAAIWPHRGWFFAINAPMNIGISNSKDIRLQRKILDIAQRVVRFFDVLADYLRYPQVDIEASPFPPLSKQQSFMDFRDFFERRLQVEGITWREKYRQTLDRLQEGPRYEGFKAFHDIEMLYLSAKVEGRPTAPPEDATPNDIEAIDLSPIGFQLVKRERLTSSDFGGVKLDIPDESVHFEYRNAQRKKVTIDLIKFPSFADAGEFYWKIRKNTDWCASDDVTPYSFFRSPKRIYKHVNAIWAEGNWVAYIRIPITQPGVEKSKQHILPEEELRTEVARLVIDSFSQKSKERN